MTIKPRIVVVNDEPFLLEAVDQMLKMRFPAAQVLLFGKPEDALAELAARDPDLLISDTMMPKLNVMDVLEFLKKRGAEYPVLVTTGGCPSDQEIMECAGANLKVHLINIPFEIEPFLRLVEQCLDFEPRATGAMTAGEFEAAYPLVYAWIEQTLATHAPRAQSVASLEFPRLAQYFPPEVLAGAKVVQVDAVPTPPLAQLGLGRFAGEVSEHAAGITYLDTFFVRNDCRDAEALHFHELVHVVQWQLLGPERFLMAYGDGLARCGYRNSPLEVMAYMLESVFRNSSTGFNVVKVVQEQLGEMRLVG